MQGTRIVLIGGSGGIGHATASQLMARGAQVCITGRDHERLRTATATLGCEGHVLEASDFEATTKVLEAASQSMGGLDAVACLAGSILLKPITMTSQPEYEETILRNLTTAFSVTRAAIRLLTDGGSIVLMSSAAASMGLPNHEAIAAAAAMASWLGSPMLAAAELIKTMLPPSVSRRIAARVTENAVVRFRRMVSSYSG